MTSIGHYCVIEQLPGPRTPCVQTHTVPLHVQYRTSAAPDLLTAPTVLPFTDHHMVGILQPEAFWTGSLNTMPLRLPCLFEAWWHIPFQLESFYFLDVSTYSAVHQLLDSSVASLLGH